MKNSMLNRRNTVHYTVSRSIRNQVISNEYGKRSPLAKVAEYTAETNTIKEYQTNPYLK